MWRFMHERYQVFSKLGRRTFVFLDHFQSRSFSMYNAELIHHRLSSEHDRGFLSINPCMCWLCALSQGIWAPGSSWVLALHAPIARILWHRAANAHLFSKAGLKVIGFLNMPLCIQSACTPQIPCIVILASGFTLGAHRDASKAKTFKFLPDKISWQRIKIRLRKPKRLVALILACLGLSQWIKETAKIKSQNLSRLPKALLKHFQSTESCKQEKYISPNPLTLTNLSAMQLWFLHKTSSTSRAPLTKWTDQSVLLPSVRPHNWGFVITTATNLEIRLQTEITTSQIQEFCSST